MAEHIKFPDKPAPKPTSGSVGLATQLPGAACTVGNVAAATGGIKPGNLISTDK